MKARLFTLALVAFTAIAFAEDPEPTPTPFEPYACSLGTVIEVEDSTYIIQTDDGRTIGVTAQGEPSEAHVEADIEAEALARAKASKVAEIHADYEAAIAAGAEVGEETYGITAADQSNWIAALTALDNAQTVAGFDPAAQDATALLGPLLNRDGEPVGPVTVTEFRAIMAALTQHIGALRAAQINGVEAVKAADTIGGVEAIDFAVP